MPIRHRIDKNGPFYQWGHQTKYYYNIHSKRSKDKAYDRALTQARAIYSSGYKG
jgi:hypothetical protein